MSREQSKMIDYICSSDLENGRNVFIHFIFENVVESKLGFTIHRIYIVLSQYGPSQSK